MAERRLSERNAKIAAMLESGESLKNFYRFIAQNEYINLHDACQIVAECPNATVCNTLEEWNAMGRRVIKGRKSIAYYDHDGYKQFVFDANDTYGDGRYRRPILPLKHLLIGLDELNGTNAYENGRGDYRKIHNGVYTYLEKQNELTGDEQYDRLLAEGIAYSLYCKTGFPKTQNIRLHGLPYSYRENAAFVKELYIRSELLAEEIEEAYQSKQSEVKIIDDIDEETVSDEPIVQSEPAEQTETQEQPEQGVETADEIRASEQESENLAPEQGAAVSSVYRQYLEAQKLDPKAIVLLRVGDFYEVMGENARTVAEEVGLTLTSRDVGLSERVPMCGFPYFASDAYMEKILEHHSVILAEDGKEPRYVLSHAEALGQSKKEETAHGEEAEELAALFGEEAEQTSPVRKPIFVEIDNEPNPFDDEQSEEEKMEEDDFADDEADFEEEPEQGEAETEKLAPKKDEKGIQDRKRKQKPQMSMFDLIEPQSEREQLIERALQYGSGVQYGKYRIFDKYNENPTPKAFADFVKHEYGIGGHGSTNGDDEWHDGKGIRISHDGTDGKIEVLLKWQDVAFRIADLIDDDNYLTEQEKAEYVKYRAEQNRKKELRAEEERQKRELIEQVIVKAPPARKQRILDEYSQTTKIVDFAVFLCDEYGTATEATSQYHARYDKNGVWMAKYDRVGNTELRVYLSWEQFAEKVCGVIERERLFAPEDAVYNQSFAERMVKQGTQNTEDGQYSFYFGTFEKDESYVCAHCEELKEALLSREEVKTVGSDEWYIHAEFYKEYCEKLKGTEEARREHDARIKAIAERIVEEGTKNTTEGNWVTFFDELSRDENFAKANAEEIAAVLELRKEVSDVELTPDAFDTNFYLDYCPNYLPQEGEDGYEESEPSNSEQGENTDLTAILDQTDLGGAKTRFKNNVAAIRLINFLDERNAAATDTEKKVLSQFVGWGGLSKAFDEKNESWKKEYAELKTLLSAEDYEQARSSTLNAYYTPKEVIGGVYAALQRFGVKANNRILEPAMGTGNFFGYMPKEIAEGSRLYGVELDNITGRIAAKLYPQASVQIKGFEDTSFPDDKFDLVVGNVPFGGYGVADSDYNRYNFKVHDYFLAKSVDKVRPGGIVAVITSKGTMDKLNPSARKYVAERAELLGAVRLPNNAFKQTAGTEAVADILFFRKREERITDLSREEWLGTGKTAEGYEINNYFLAHPEMVLGTLAEEHGLYGGIDTTVKPDGRDLKDALAEAILHLPQGFYNNPETPPEQERETEVDYNVKPFCYKAERGKLYQRMGDEMIEQSIPKTPKDAYQRIQAMIALREGLHHILDIQIAGCSDEALQSEQKKLNAQYDLFVRRYGNLNSQTNVKLFKDDGDSALLFACENVNEETKAITKADIFFKRTIRPYAVPTSTDDPFEALQISKNERGKVDIAYIEELTGKSYDTVLSELGSAVFRDPEQVNAEDQYSGFVTAEEYLSGQVVAKLERARSVSAEHPEYQRNADALEAVQPEPLTASEIAVRLGATWVDKSYYKQFYCELVGLFRYQYSDVELFYNPHDSSWRLDQTPSVRYSTQMKQTEVYGTKRAPAYRLFIDAMNLKATTIYDTIEEDGKEKRVLNQAETIAAREKQNKIKEAFAEWIFKTPERREELEATYNRLFNRTRLPSYDGSYLKFPEMNPAIELKLHQKNAVHRIITGDSSTLLHHVVGAGKTFTVIASIMKMRQLGLCKKAMVTVPNHLVQQWAGEWRKLYPNANILVATKEDLEKDNRKKFVSKAALGDWDGIIIAQSSFAKIPVSKERQIEKLQEEIESVIETIEKQWEESGAPRGAVKNLERIKKTKETQLKKLMADGGKDDVLKFEDLGVDYLFVDEAQNFKNLFLFTKMNNVAGISNAASQRASDLKLKCEYLQDLHDSDRGVAFATGTPISNSMTEMYTMQTYLQPSVLRDLGITFFDGWAADFGETITSMELTPSGQGYRARTRFAKFTNLPELLKLYRSFADVQTADMVKLNVPEAERHVVNLKPSDTIIELAEEIADRADRIYGGGVDSHIDNMLKVTSDGKKLALDPRCFVPTSEDEEGSKLNACAQNIFEIWEDTQGFQGTQIVFCDLSTPKVRFDEYEYGTDFDAYNDLKFKLVQKGIPAQEIAFIHEANTEEQKQALFDKVNSGAVRVLVGSTEKCGAGTNVQKRLVALHHLDTPYRPSDMEQREGRIIRQGNTSEKVQIYTYVMERTFDSYSYQILENKQRFISQINRGDLTIREAEDIDETTLSYAEIKAITAANPKIKRKMEVDAEVARLRVLEGQYKKNLYELQDKIYKTYPEEIRKQELLIERIGKDLEMLKTRRPADPEAFEISVNGTVYTDRKEGGKALTDALYASKVGTPVAEYCGFVVSMNPMSFLSNERDVTLAGEGQYAVTIGESASGNLTRLDNFLNDLPAREGRLKIKLEQLKSDLAIAKEQVEKPFEQAEKLKELLSEQAQLNAELNLNQREEVIVDDGDEEEEIAYRALPENRKTEVDIIDEEDKIAAMQVDLLPDYTVTQEDMHAYGYTWDGMLPVSGTAAKTLANAGIAVNELRTNDTEGLVDDLGIFDEKDKLFGVEKPEWNAFLRSTRGQRYVSARQQLIGAVCSLLNKDEMSEFGDEFISSIRGNYERENVALTKYAESNPEILPDKMEPYAELIFDEQYKKLTSLIPLKEHGWSKADIHFALTDVEDGDIMESLTEYAYDSRVEDFIDEKLKEIKWLNGKTADFTDDEMERVANDLSEAFKDSEFDMREEGETYDEWYDYFKYDKVRPILKQRMPKYAVDTNYRFEDDPTDSDEQYEDNPLDLPAQDDTLTVLAVQPDVQLDEKRTLPGLKLLKNEEIERWYVVNRAAYEGERELKIGDRTTLEELEISPMEFEPNVIRTFYDEQSAKDFYSEKVRVKNSVKDNSGRKEIDYEAEVIKSVNTEFEVYKADVLSKPPEDIFYENYKIHVMTELKEVIEEGVQDGYLEKEHYKALYEERGSILTGLYDDFIGDEYASVNSYGETAEFIKNYCEQYHQSAMYAGAPLYLKTARYAREHGESEQYHRSHELSNTCREEMDKAISENFDGMHLKEGFEQELMERYGRERVEYLLATTVKENAWDGRYSRENREWADSIPVSESESERIACCLHSHPAVIDGLIRRVRRNEHEKQQEKEEEDLAESKYLKETARGYKVMSIAQDKNGRNVAVVQRKNDFSVAIGYDTSDGTWAQGVYDFKDEKAANEYREKYYGRDVEPPEKWYEVFVSRDALIKSYEKSSLMRMPSSNPEYADYTYFVYNNRIKESRQLVDMQSDSRELCYKILLSEGEVVNLRNRDGDEVELTAQEFSELVNHTSDKDYKRAEKPRVSVNIPQAAMIRSYEKASLFRAPNGTDFAGYSYYLPNSVLHESADGSNAAEARLAEDFTVRMCKGEEEVELTVKEFSELVGKTTAEDYKREPTAMDEYREQQAEKEQWKEIAVSEQAVIANYEKSTLFKMPKGKYEGMVYYIPSGMVRRDENGIRLRLPEDFEVHLKDKSANENIDITPAELEAELSGKNDEDYEGIYRRPSEEAIKKFEKVEKNLRERLPDEMKSKPNWVVVRTRENKETGRLDKFLIDVHTDKFAESDNPETWADFDTACKYAKEHGGVALAYALDGTDGIACIDLDHCVGKDGKRSALADEVLSKCGKTYTEHSVSGRGIHVFGRTKGADLRSFSKEGDMEYYQDRHFITMTGDGAGYSRLESFDTPEMQSLLERKLERRTEWKNVGKGEAGLSQMDDRELLKKAVSAKNGDTVRRLYHGEDLRRNHSNSDMSLMNYLAFYSGGNVEQMTRIFATSGLFRPDKPASYYEYTAIKAAKDTPHYTPPKVKSSAPKSASGGNSK